MERENIMLRELTTSTISGIETDKERRLKELNARARMHTHIDIRAFYFFGWEFEFPPFGFCGSNCFPKYSLKRNIKRVVIFTVNKLDS